MSARLLTRGMADDNAHAPHNRDRSGHRPQRGRIRRIHFVHRGRCRLVVDFTMSYEIKILSALSEDGGRLTGQIARTFPSPFNRTTRQHSGDVREWLMAMKKEGFVRLMDNQKPDAWLRTAKGTKYFKRYQKESK